MKEGNTRRADTLFSVSQCQIENSPLLPARGAVAVEDGGAFRLAIHLCHVQSTLSVPIPCVIVDDMLLGQVLDSADAA